jgi:hypothetical protein
MGSATDLFQVTVRVSWRITLVIVVHINIHYDICFVMGSVQP